MSAPEMQCSVYKSDKMELAFLYIEAGADLAELPAELMLSFGDPQWVMNIELWADRKLALAKASDVMNAVREHGYYLQMPPAADHAIRKL